jgi:hypothetical protein
VVTLTDDYILVRLKHLSKTIECGIHSGIPACCILHYVTVHIWRTREEQSAYLALVDATARNVDYDYIPCPQCLEARAFVETRACPNGVRCQHGEEQAGHRPPWTERVWNGTAWVQPHE